MPCTIQVRNVNGVVPAGQSAPTLLRVTGNAGLCGGGQVTITSTITGPSGPVSIDPATGQFRADLPITATPAPACGDQVTVRVECTSAPTTCFDQQTEALACCEIPTLFFDAEVPLGSLTPTQLRVQGVLLGCPTDQVIVSSSVTGSSGPIAVDQYTGAFSVALPITSAVKCDDRVTVTAACASSPACTATAREKLACTDCYRATINQTGQACTGNPAVQPVTLDATINIPAGATMQFYWDFGDGQQSAPFTVNNTTGTASTQHTNSATHNYAPGTYTATLKVVGPPFECREVSTTVVAQCQSCPTITLGTPVVGSTCTNGKRTVTLPAQITAAGGQAAVVQWDYGDPQGSSLGPATVANPGATLPYSQTHDYAPGTYTARLKTIVPQGCPDYPVQVTVQPCQPPVCNLQIQDIQLQVGACNSNGTRTVTATALLNGSDPADLHAWQWDANPSQTWLPGPAGLTQQHDYPAPTTGPTTETVKLVVTRGASCVATLSKQVTIDPCGFTCPTITGITSDAPGTCTADRTRRVVNLNATVNGTGITQYVWDFGDGTTQSLPGGSGPSTNHAFAPGTYTVRITGTGPGSCSTTTTLQITVDPCPPPTNGNGNGNGGPPSCEILLWLAMILMLVGMVAVLVGCLISSAVPQVGFWLQLIGWIVFGIGWILFIIWLIFCSSVTACRVILAVRAFVMWLIAIFAVISIVLSIIGAVNTSFLVCALFSWAYTANWGVVLLILDKVAEARGCIILNPSGGSGSGGSGSGGTGSSSSGLTSERSYAAVGAHANPDQQSGAKANTDDCGCG